MKRRRMMGALVLRVVLLLAMGVQSPFGLTLCLADDGHAALELAHGTLPCASEVRRHNPGAESLTAFEFARHPCRDVPLLERAAYRTTEAASIATPACTFVAHVRPVTEMGPVSTLRTGWALGLGPPKMTTRSIRSVIIRA